MLFRSLSRNVTTGSAPMQIHFQTTSWIIQLGPRTLTGLNISGTTQATPRSQNLQTSGVALVAFWLLWRPSSRNRLCWVRTGPRWDVSLFSAHRPGHRTGDSRPGLTIRARSHCGASCERYGWIISEHFRRPCQLHEVLAQLLCQTLALINLLFVSRPAL